MGCKAARTLVAPGFQALRVGMSILMAAEGDDGARQRRLGPVLVAFAHRQVGPDDGKNGAAEVGILEHLARGPAEPPQPESQGVIGEPAQARQPPGPGGRVPAGGDERFRRGLSRAPQPAGQLESEQRTHAVAEEGEGPVEPGLQPGGEGPHERLPVGAGRLVAPRLPTRELDEADLDPGQAAGPTSE